MNDSTRPDLEDPATKLGHAIGELLNEWARRRNATEEARRD